ncbi:MAG: hypothetical protein E6767_14525 [Dysgonomonas sp.]|nr:hypothetical protein [Dysgonomonas sp.]
MRRLEKVIKDIPLPFDKTSFFDTEYYSYARIEADASKLSLIIKDEIYKYKGGWLYIPLIISFLFSLYISWIFLKAAFLIVFAYILYYCVFGIKVKSSKAIIFNRKAGTVSYPVYEDEKIVSYIKPFDECDFVINEQENIPTALYIGHTEDLQQNPLITYKQPQRVWSFIVWYMDKNRPLPSGEILEPYREQDQKRRSKAGFLPPLYPSEIDFSETT